MCIEDVNLRYSSKGSHPIKKCHKKWKKSTRGGGGSKKHQKVQNSKFGLFDKRGGEAIFSFFSQIQMFTLDTSVEEKIS